MVQLLNFQVAQNIYSKNVYITYTFVCLFFGLPFLCSTNKCFAFSLAFHLKMSPKYNTEDEKETLFMLKDKKKNALRMVEFP